MALAPTLTASPASDPDHPPGQAGLIERAEAEEALRAQARAAAAAAADEVAARRGAEQKEAAAREAAQAGQLAVGELRSQLRAAHAATAEAQAAQRQAEETAATTQRSNAELRELGSASAARLAQAEI